MTETFDYVVNHMDDILNIASLALAAASAIVALTPTQADDSVVGRLRNLVDTAKAFRLFRK